MKVLLYGNPQDSDGWPVLSSGDAVRITGLQVLFTMFGFNLSVCCTYRVLQYSCWCVGLLSHIWLLVEIAVIALHGQ
jgi:hypothetical protein